MWCGQAGAACGHAHCKCVIMICMYAQAWLRETALWQCGHEGSCIPAPGEYPLGYRVGLQPHTLDILKAKYDLLARCVIFDSNDVEQPIAAADISAPRIDCESVQSAASIKTAQLFGNVATQMSGLPDAGCKRSASSRDERRTKKVKYDPAKATGLAQPPTSRPAFPVLSLPPPPPPPPPPPLLQQLQPSAQCLVPPWLPLDQPSALPPTPQDAWTKLILDHWHINYTARVALWLLVTHSDDGASKAGDIAVSPSMQAQQLQLSSIAVVSIVVADCHVLLGHDCTCNT